MPIMDKMLEMATTVALDLGNPGIRSDSTSTVAPHGPGRSVVLQITGITAGTITITTGATSAAADTFMTVVCSSAEFTQVPLPSNCKRYIKATFADGSVDVVLDKTQTAL